MTALTRVTPADANAAATSLTSSAERIDRKVTFDPTHRVGTSRDYELWVGVNRGMKQGTAVFVRAFPDQTALGVRLINAIETVAESAGFNNRPYDKTQDVRINPSYLTALRSAAADARQAATLLAAYKSPGA